MLTRDVAAMIASNLETVRTELNAYENETDLWIVADGINNSAANLALHIAGNLQHYFGAVLGSTGYVRDREAEFSIKNVARADIIKELDVAGRAVEQTLADLTEDCLEKEYPEKILSYPLTIGQVLLRLTAHLNYHMGQINYHRRLIAGDKQD